MTGPGPLWPEDAASFVPAESDLRATSRISRSSRLVSLFFLILALALSTRPVVSMPIGCLMCGWEEIRTSRWLKRTDPIRARGRTCSRFYLAWGLWKISLVSTAMMFLIMIVQGVIDGRAGSRAQSPSPPPEFVACGITTMAGYLISTAASGFAVASSLGHRVRVWVGPEARWARSDGIWPPPLAQRRKETKNQAKLILIGSMITTDFVLLPLAFIPFAFFQPLESMSPIFSIAIVLFLLVAVPASTLLLMEWLLARIMTRTPWECWSAVE